MADFILRNETIIQDSFCIKTITKEFLENEKNLCSIYNQVILIEKGSGNLSILENTHRITDCELILIPKNEVYRFGQGTKIKGLILSFGDCVWERSPSSNNDCKSLLFDGVSFRSIKLSTSTYNSLRSIMNELLSEFKESYYINKIDVLAAYLKIIMIKVANIYEALGSSFSDFDRELYQSFLKEVEQKSNERLSVNEYADILNTSPKKLSNVCRAIGETSPKNILNNKLIADAKYHLIFTTSPMKEIAYQLNFQSIYQFSHFFKKHTGFPPKKYRTVMTQIDK
ncbi:MAG: helix-turn-helix domain-containing protein [Algicola sp.]|nr:helix-turn-helix domain-containing protein [Algicola sp.]